MLARTTSWLDTVTGFGATKVEPLDWLGLEYLAFNMRDIDREEVFDNMPSDNPLAFAALLHGAIATNGCGWIAYFDGRPAACMGVAENFPGNWQIYSFGTERYMRVLVHFKPKLDAMWAFGQSRGMHRVECRSLANHHQAHRCIAMAGLTKEGVLRQFGRHRQDYVLFSRVF